MPEQIRTEEKRERGPGKTKYPNLRVFHRILLFAYLTATQKQSLAGSLPICCRQRFSPQAPALNWAALVRAFQKTNAPTQI